MKRQTPADNLPDLKIVERAMLQTPSREKFESQRNLCFGGAAVCAAMLIALTQVGTKDFALKVTTVASAFAVPFWVALALMAEFYIHIGPTSYPHSSTKFAQALSKAFTWLAVAGLIAALVGIIWFLLPWAVAAFAVGLTLALVLFAGFLFQLTEWWQSNASHPSQDR